MKNRIKTIKDDLHLSTIELKLIDVNPGDKVVITKYYDNINDKQKGLYFELLEYALNNGLKQLGHYSKDGLHEDIKYWGRTERPLDIGSFSLKESVMPEFITKLEIIDREYLGEICHIDTSQFWEEYKEWQDYCLNNGYIKYSKYKA
jgi:hypothetical protein